MSDDSWGTGHGERVERLLQLIDSDDEMALQGDFEVEPTSPDGTAVTLTVAVLDEGYFDDE